MYRLGYHEASLSIAQSYYKDYMAASLLMYESVYHKEYEFVFHIIFSFLMSSISNMWNVYLVLCITEDSFDVGTDPACKQMT